MYKILKTQLKVTKSDAEYIDRLCILRHKCWNSLVEYFNPRYKEKNYPTMTELDRFLTDQYPELPSAIRKATWQQYREAWSQTFRIKNRRQPRYHRIEQATRFTINQQNGLSVKNNIFNLSREHHIPLCEKFPDKSQTKAGGWFSQIHISVNCSKYYVTFIWKEEYPVEQSNSGEIGLDYGIKNFLTDNNGDIYNFPMRYYREKQRIKSLQKILSKKSRSKNGQSNNYQRVKRKLGLAWRRLQNIKKDFIEQLTTKLCRENRLIAVEDLNLTGIAKLGWKARRELMSDQAYAYFVKRLQEKCVTRFTCLLYQAPPDFPSSQRCSKCGKIHREMKCLNNRVMKCECGLEIDRDQNAAINLLQKAHSVMSGTADVTAG